MHRKLQKLKETDLHVHTVGCYHPQQLFEMAKDCYREINWMRFGFLERYRDVFGVQPDPVAVFERACNTLDLQELEEISVYQYSAKGQFEEFNTKSLFAAAISGYYPDREKHEPILSPIVQRHRKDGLKYVEYRNAFATSGEEFKDWHGRFAEYLKDASDQEFTARYIIRLDSSQAVPLLAAVRELIQKEA